FQAEDGIRDLIVTGVQTCALPICATRSGPSTSKPSVSNALTCGVMLASFLMQLVEQRVSKPSLGGAARGTRPPHRLCGRTPHEQIGRASCRERASHQERDSVCARK